MCIFSKLPCSVHVSGYCSYLFDTEKLFILDTIGKGFVSLNVTFSWLERATVKISPWNMNPIPVPSDVGLAIFYTTTDYLHSECRFFWKSNVKRLRISKVLQWGMPVSFGFNIRLSPILNLRCSHFTLFAACGSSVDRYVILCLPMKKQNIAKGLHCCYAITWKLYEWGWTRKGANMASFRIISFSVVIKLIW